MQANSPYPFQAFGQQLTCDAYNCDKSLLNDFDVVYSFLDQLPNILEMHKMIQPQIYRCDAGKEEDYGVSGFIIITESHISFHSFPNKSYISIDIFSCKPFDTDIALDFIKKTFDVKGKIETYNLERGLEFPRNINLTKNIVTRQREELL